MSRRVLLVPAAMVVAVIVIAITALGGLTSDRRPTGVIRDPAGAPASPTPRITPVPMPGHEVYGFVPYWEMEGDIVEHVAGTSLTTVGLFSVTHTRRGPLDTSENGYRRITSALGRQLARAAQDQGARVELVYTSFGEAKNRRFFGDAAVQAKTIEALVSLTADLELDGVNVDVESLAFDDISAYGEFVGRLRTALRDRIDVAQVSVATGSGTRGAAMANLALANGADRIFVMGYDYHWSGSVPGASAPLDTLDPDARDLQSTLDLYLATDVAVERTILGLPLYGMVWPVESAEPDADRTGAGDAWIPSDNLNLLRDEGAAAVRDPVQVVERLLVETSSGWQAIYYDSPETLSPKLGLANERGLAGAGFWALGYERGLPGYTNLIARFAAGKTLTPD